MRITVVQRDWQVRTTAEPIAAQGEQWAGWADYEQSMLYIWRGADQPLVTLCRLIERLIGDSAGRPATPRAAGIRLTPPDEQGRRYLIRFYDAPGDAGPGRA